VVEQLKKHYSELNILCILIWPHKSGEVVLQTTNALFTLTTLYSSSDAIINIENDDIQETVKTSLNILKPGLED